ncbi:MAG: hypothetical protein V4487_02770 [Chlamydiota bacterium]
MKKISYALALAFCCSSLTANELPESPKLNRPQLLSEEFLDQLCDLDEEEAFEFFHALLANVKRDFGIVLDIEQVVQASLKVIVDSGEFTEEELSDVEEFYRQLIEWSHTQKSESWGWGFQKPQKSKYLASKCRQALCDIIQQRLSFAK